MEWDVGRITLSSVFGGKHSSIIVTIVLSFLGFAISFALIDKPFFNWIYAFIICHFTFFIIILTLIASNQNSLIERLKENYKDSANLIFKNNLYGTTKEIGIALTRAADTLDLFEKRISNLNIDDPKLNDKMDKILLEFHDKFLHYIKMSLDAVTNNTCDIIHHHLKTSGIGTFNISSCVKQLAHFYVKPKEEDYSSNRYETKLENLEVETVYRDSQSYYNDREIGKVTYNVLNNDTFAHCLTKDPLDAIYSKDNLSEAYKNDNYKTENKNFEEYYNSTVCIPISREIDIGIICYGFLTIDCKSNSNKKIFESDNCKHILLTFANLLAIVYYYVDTKFLTYYKTIKKQLNQHKS